MDREFVPDIEADVSSSASTSSSTDDDRRHRVRNLMTITQMLEDNVTGVLERIRYFKADLSNQQRGRIMNEHLLEQNNMILRDILEKTQGTMALSAELKLSQGGYIGTLAQEMDEASVNTESTADEDMREGGAALHIVEESGSPDALPQSELLPYEWVEILRNERYTVTITRRFADEGNVSQSYVTFQVEEHGIQG